MTARRESAGRDPLTAKTRRVYVPIGAEGLRSLASGAAVPIGAAYAVTAAVRAAFPGDDEEDLEDDALYTAAADDLAGPRCIVAAADLSASLLTENDDFSVRISGEMPVRSVVSLHLTEASHEDPPELLWYDTSELGELVRLLR